MKHKVLCWIHYEKTNLLPPEEEIWLDEKDYAVYQKARLVEKVVPLINHLHNDIENGQPEQHYHVDDRYQTNLLFGPSRITFPLKEGKLEFRSLKQYYKRVKTPTSRGLIVRSKLKHNCIFKGKCPHRGYDLSNEKPILNHDTKQWEIVCPLHSLRFNATTKQLISETDNKI